MVHNPGGDWHPGKGDNPRYIYLHENHQFQPNVGKYTSPMDPMGPYIKSQKNITPLKTNMSPEIHWLEDVFPTEIGPL